jgi:hypothetical protein
MTAMRLQRPGLAACAALVCAALVCAALVCAALAGAALACPAQGDEPASVAASGEALHWQEPWIQLHDARAAASRSDEYAWRLFIAVNWPAAARERTADPAASFGTDRPAVWETWQHSGDIFLDDGSDPGPWASGAKWPAAAAASVDTRRFETVSLKDLPNARHIVHGRMVPLLDPISSARRLTEIRMNRAAYEYIRAAELYNVGGQLKLLALHRAPHFPADSTEVKAQWRPIRPEQRSRYHSLELRLPDGTTRLYGLTALHIATKDLPTWFWATFEQVDNPAQPDSDGWQLPSRDRFACGTSRADCNRAPAGIGLEGTVWRFYRLRGTLTRFVDANGAALRLANSELEAGMQQTASCMTCHARASIGLLEGKAARLPIFDGRAGAEAEDPNLRRGYLGLPQANWFGGLGVDPDSPTRFQPLDFVWSLSKAQPKRESQ